MVEIYCEELLEKTDRMFEGNKFCFLSSSIRSLLAETNAISIPEKNADNRTVIIMIITISIIYNYECIKFITELKYFICL
jgi:hypothetical protein